MYCIIKYIVQGKQGRVKNTDLRHPSCTVVMQKRKSASPVLNVLSPFVHHRSTAFCSYRILWHHKVKSHLAGKGDAGTVLLNFNGGVRWV